MRHARAAMIMLGAVAALSCSETVERGLGDAMIDAADMLSDAGNQLSEAGTVDAQTNPPEDVVVPVACDLEEMDLRTNGSGHQVTTVRYAWVPVPRPRAVMVQRCGYSETASCAVGATCDIRAPIPACRLELPRFEGNQVYVECYRRISNRSAADGTELSWVQTQATDVSVVTYR